MADRNKGFDPLSALFEVPDPALGVPLPKVEEEEDDRTGPTAPSVDYTDPLFKVHPDAVNPMPTDVPEPPKMPHGATRPGRGKVAGKGRVRRQATRAEVIPEPDTAETPSPSPAAMSAEEQARIARAVAEAAKARLDRAQSTPAARPSAAASPQPTPKAPRKKRSRLDSLAARAVRPRSALEAAREAARAEQELEQRRAREAAARRVQELTDRVQALIPACLPSVGSVYVANAIVADQRDVLRAIWKAHRSKFLADGQLERAVGAALVLHALERVPEGELVAAHVVTDASDYLVWIDMKEEAVLAAFADARAWYTQL